MVRAHCPRLKCDGAEVMSTREQEPAEMFERGMFCLHCQSPLDNPLDIGITARWEPLMLGDNSRSLERGKNLSIQCSFRVISGSGCLSPLLWFTPCPHSSDITLGEVPNSLMLIQALSWTVIAKLVSWLSSTHRVTFQVSSKSTYTKFYLSPNDSHQTFTNFV